jgi:hypothetical protein
LFAQKLGSGHACDANTLAPSSLPPAYVPFAGVALAQFMKDPEWAKKMSLDKYIGERTVEQLCEEMLRLR